MDWPSLFGGCMAEPLTIVDTIGRIVLKGMEIFSDERKRYWQDLYFQRLKSLDDAKNKKLQTGYTDAEVVLAHEEIERFYLAYEADFSAKLADVIEKAKKAAV